MKNVIKVEEYDVLHREAVRELTEQRVRFYFRKGGWIEICPSDRGGISILGAANLAACVEPNNSPHAG